MATKDKKIKWREYKKFGVSQVKYGDVSPRHNHTVQLANTSGVPVTHHTSGVIDTSPEPVNKEVSDIASNIAKEIAKQTDLRVAAVLEEGGKEEWIAWFQNETEHWKQRCEELEIQLECMRDAFPEHDNDIIPKHRGIF